MYLFLLTGFVGAMLMFVGDMVLYYSKDDYVSDGTLKPVIDIMGKESRKRLYVGGLLGPVAAFVYCVGYYHLVLMMDEGHMILGWCCFVINCIGIICGGVYHSHCAYLGLIGRHKNEEVMDEVCKYMDVQKLISFGLQGLGFILLAVVIALNWTVFPRWLVLFTPGILFLLLPLMKKLPKGLHMVICGGWTNLISVIYYGVALIISLLK